jgi:hypothetical protein
MALMVLLLCSPLLCSWKDRRKPGELVGKGIFRRVIRGVGHQRLRCKGLRLGSQVSPWEEKFPASSARACFFSMRSARHAPNEATTSAHNPNAITTSPKWSKCGVIMGSFTAMSRTSGAKLRSVKLESVPGF